MSKQTIAKPENISDYMLSDTGLCLCHRSGKEHVVDDECRASWKPIANPRCTSFDERQDIHYWTGIETGDRCECGAKRRPYNWGKPWHGDRS